MTRVPRRALLGLRELRRDDRGVARLESEPGAEAVGQAQVVDVFAPMAIHSVGTPTSRANEARALSVESPQPSQLVRKPRQSASTA